MPFEVVEGFAALQPDLPYLKEILFDVYYDRAVAEFILVNRSLDQARIDWVNDADVSVASLERSRQNAVDILQSSLNEYWSLIDNHPQAYVTQLPQRDLQSARYLNGQGPTFTYLWRRSFSSGYKRRSAGVSMMNSLLEQQVHLEQAQSGVREYRYNASVSSRGAKLCLQQCDIESYAAWAVIRQRCASERNVGSRAGEAE